LDISESFIKAPGKNRKASKCRAILAFFVREIENLTIEELATFLARDSSGLSKLAKSVEMQILQSLTFAEEMNQLRKLILMPGCSQMSECQA
jgi:chromosomal replication initiation ATPase DnaA